MARDTGQRAPLATGLTSVAMVQPLVSRSQSERALSMANGTTVSAPGVYATSTDGGFLVSQAGSCRLWDRLEEAYTFWQQTGRPTSDRFGITATPTEQYVWYDHPDSEHRWPLPTSANRQTQPSVSRRCGFVTSAIHKVKRRLKFTPCGVSRSSRARMESAPPRRLGVRF